MRSPMRGSADEACRSIADDGDCLDDRAGVIWPRATALRNCAPVIQW
jgi:hypothetical protein